jgi:hypothetical protein
MGFFIFGVIRISSNFLKHIQQGLKKNYGDQLYSASGRTIRQLDWREESYKRLHKKFKRAVPKQWEAYSLSVLLYDIAKGNDHLIEFHLTESVDQKFLII